MASTTNYGWATPDDTSLVKDGASAIRTLGSSIDTTTKALNPETTLGDIAYRSSTSNTNTRLGIGSTGQVLTVSGGVPAWATPSAGSLTLLSTTSLSGATTTISSISQDYTHLFMTINGVTNATANGNFRCLPNSSTANSSANNAGITIQQDASSTATLKAYSRNHMLFSVDNALDRTSIYNSWTAFIYNYTNTTAYQTYQINGGFSGNVEWGYFSSGIRLFLDPAAITELQFSNSGGNLSAGTVKLYGVK